MSPSAPPRSESSPPPPSTASRPSSPLSESSPALPSHPVVSRTAAHAVALGVGHSAVEGIVARAAGDRVGAREPVDRVAVGASRQQVAGLSADQPLDVERDVVALAGRAVARGPVDRRDHERARAARRSPSRCRAPPLRLSSSGMPCVGPTPGLSRSSPAPPSKRSLPRSGGKPLVDVEVSPSWSLPSPPLQRVVGVAPDHEVVARRRRRGRPRPRSRGADRRRRRHAPCRARRRRSRESLPAPPERLFAPPEEAVTSAVSPYSSSSPAPPSRVSSPNGARGRVADELVVAAAARQRCRRRSPPNTSARVGAVDHDRVVLVVELGFDLDDPGAGAGRDVGRRPLRTARHGVDRDASRVGEGVGAAGERDRQHRWPRRPCRRRTAARLVVRADGEAPPRPGRAPRPSRRRRRPGPARRGRSP